MRSASSFAGLLPQAEVVQFSAIRPLPVLDGVNSTAEVKGRLEIQAQMRRTEDRISIPENRVPRTETRSPTFVPHSRGMALQPGTAAPEFKIRSKDASGLTDVSLADYAGKPLLILFFPAAFTGVCTQEFCDVSGGIQGYKDLGIDVLGISCDTAFCQEAWAKSNNISVKLGSDYKHEVCAAYDVVLPDLAGHGPASKRAAFVINSDGVIAYSEETPTPGDLPDFNAIQNAIKAL